ncbi:MAG: uroporphyrinogen decarboxylase family protein [Candidatus Latescibacterota bacterium]
MGELSERERFGRRMRLQGEPLVRSHVAITYPVWKEFGSRLDWLEGFSPHVHAGISRTPGRQAYAEETDRWGCRWIYPLESLDGQCIGHPLASYEDLAAWRPPDPAEFTDWEQARRGVAQAHQEGRPYCGGTDHGFVFLRLTYLRGFHRLMLDVAEERPELDRLIGIVEGYWLGVVERWVEAGVDEVSFGDDLGLQERLPISPQAWRRHLKPSYRRIFSRCREHGVHVHLHTDGHILEIIPDLIECGVSTLNPQDLVNGLDNLQRLARGKVYLHLDIDRQKLTVFGTPRECEAHVLACIGTLGSPRGGLSCVWGVYPGTPLANIEAVVRALDRHAAHWC